jgi:hypothetical protein
MKRQQAVSQSLKAFFYSYNCLYGNAQEVDTNHGCPFDAFVLNGSRSSARYFRRTKCSSKRVSHSNA